ncbi:MAG: Imm39 family immunity protein [Thermoleophilia bacterium]
MHDRKIVLSGISLTKARPNKYGFDVMGEIMDEVEALMEESSYLEGAPFKWVGISLRYGLKNEDEPHYQGIDNKYEVLELAIELDTHDLIKVERDVIKRIFMLATLIASHSRREEVRATHYHS